MKKAWIILLFVFFSSACTKIDVKEGEKPDIQKITPQSIQTGLPVINIDIDENEFKNMYSNYGAKILVDAPIDYYGEDRTIVFFDKPARIEIKGTSSASYAMKSIGMTFETPVDNRDKNIIDPIRILAGDDLDYLQSLRMRNSGNDFGRTMIKDLCYTELAIRAGLDIELMYGKPVHAFINEAYFGLLNLRTESNIYGLSGLLHADSSDISLMKVDKDNENLEYDEGSKTFALKVEKAIELEDWNTLKDLIDIDSFLDYVIYQDYIGNIDWPHNNAKAYSASNEALRFFLFDLDYAAYRTKNPILPELEYKNSDISKIFQALLEKDENFRKKLELRQRQLYRYLSPSAFNEIVDEFAVRIENEIPYLISKYKQPSSLMEWQLELDALKREFRKRDHYMRKKYNTQTN